MRLRRLAGGVAGVGGGAGGDHDGPCVVYLNF